MHNEETCNRPAACTDQSGAAGAGRKSNVVMNYRGGLGKEHDVELWKQGGVGVGIGVGVGGGGGKSKLFLSTWFKSPLNSSNYIWYAPFC